MGPSESANDANARQPRVSHRGGRRYFGYFGSAAGDPAKGYYSYDLGAWHIVVLNSNSACTTISCSTRSAQVQWLKADLAANTKSCTLAYWHHPRFNSGAEHGNLTAVAPFWMPSTRPVQRSF